MLARLESIAGIDHAQIDYRGDLLRLELRHESALDPATGVLNELGYHATVATETEAPAVAAWYDRGSVRELSRVEAGVIADRIVPPFARARTISMRQSEDVRAAIVDALHDCFIRTPLDSGPSLGEFRFRCERAVEEHVRSIVGPDAATALARLLNLDMSEDHRHS